MGTNKDKYVKPGEWAKHFRPFFKRLYWSKSRIKSREVIEEQLKEKIMKFKEWFDSNLIVGSYPKNVNELFDATEFNYVVNMSDEFYFPIDMELQMNGCKTFWFPMNEIKKDIGLNSIYAAMIVMYEAEMANKRVYLHCHAGVNRSRATQAAYHFMRTGKQYESDTSTGYINRLVAMSMRGYLPPKAEMEKFLTELNSKLTAGIHKHPRLSAGMLDAIKLETIDNF